MIGGTEGGAGNTITMNRGNGISLSAGALGNQVQGNFIGTDASGASGLSNGLDGVNLSETTTTLNTIGGASIGARNVISGNMGSGISLTAGASSNQVLGNFIGTNASGTSALPNADDGVDLADSNTTGNTIGGTVAGARNVISGNTGAGVSLSGRRVEQPDPRQLHRHRCVRPEPAPQ